MGDDFNNMLIKVVMFVALAAMVAVAGGYFLAFIK